MHHAFNMWLKQIAHSFINCRYGDINGDGKKMNNKNWAKLCRDCEFIDNKKIQPGDVDNIFSKWK